MAFGWMQYIQTRNLPVHSSMAAVSNIIWETCKTYLVTQGKFLLLLEVFIGVMHGLTISASSGTSAGEGRRHPALSV